MTRYYYYNGIKVVAAKEDHIFGTPVDYAPKSNAYLYDLRSFLHYQEENNAGEELCCELIDCGSDDAKRTIPFGSEIEKMYQRAYTLDGIEDISIFRKTNKSDYLSKIYSLAYAYRDYILSRYTHNDYKYLFYDIAYYLRHLIFENKVAPSLFEGVNNIFCCDSLAEREAEIRECLDNKAFSVSPTTFFSLNATSEDVRALLSTNGQLNNIFGDVAKFHVDSSLDDSGMLNCTFSNCDYFGLHYSIRVYNEDIYLVIDGNESKVTLDTIEVSLQKASGF